MLKRDNSKKITNENKTVKKRKSIDDYKIINSEPLVSKTRP